MLAKLLSKHKDSVFSMPKLKHHEISAVHEKELEELLESLNLLQEVNEGLIKCQFCGIQISLKNLRCVYPKNNEIIFCCEKIGCFQQALLDSKGEETESG